MGTAQPGTRCLLKTKKHAGWVSYKDRTPRSRFVGYFLSLRSLGRVRQSSRLKAARSPIAPGDE